MSIAPWWCGTIIATKSRSPSPEGLIIIAAIILSMAARFSARNAASPPAAASVAAAATSARADSATRGMNLERLEFMGAVSPPFAAEELRIDDNRNRRVTSAVVGVPVALRELGAHRAPEDRRHALRDHGGEVVPVAVAVELARRGDRFDLGEPRQLLAAPGAVGFQCPEGGHVLGDFAPLVVAAQRLEIGSAAEHQHRVQAPQPHERKQP